MDFDLGHLTFFSHSLSSFCVTLYINICGGRDWIATSYKLLVTFHLRIYVYIVYRGQISKMKSH